MEERQRIRIVDYEGLTKVDQSAIEEKLKEKGMAVRLDSFLDPGTLNVWRPWFASSTRRRDISTQKSRRR